MLHMQDQQKNTLFWCMKGHVRIQDASAQKEFHGKMAEQKLLKVETSKQNTESSVEEKI